MTIIDVFLLLPMWARIIICIFLFIWVIESFLAPFKSNIRDHRYKEIEKTLNQILSATKTNTEKFNDTQTSISILFGLLGEKKNKERKE